MPPDNPDSTKPTRPEWGDDPPPFTAEEIEDIRQNGLNLSDVIASILAEIERMPDGPDQPYIVDDSPPPEDRP